MCGFIGSGAWSIYLNPEDVYNFLQDYSMYNMKRQLTSMQISLQGHQRPCRIQEKNPGCQTDSAVHDEPSPMSLSRCAPENGRTISEPCLCFLENWVFVLFLKESSRSLPCQSNQTLVVSFNTFHLSSPSNGLSLIPNYDKLIRIKQSSPPPEGLSIATFGDSDSIQIGEEVLAIGNPLLLICVERLTDSPCMTQRN